MIRVAIDPRHRETVFLALALGLGLCLVVLHTLVSSSAKRLTDVHAKRASSFFTDATGTRAIYLVLKRFLPTTAQWRRPPTVLETPASQNAATTLLVFGPSQSLSASQAQALDEWIMQGGQLVVATHHDWPIREPEAAVDPEAPGQEAAAGPASDSGYLRRHGFQLLKWEETEAARHAETPLMLGPYALAWNDDTPGYTRLVTQGQQVLAGSKRLGRGRLVAIPDAEAFSNQRLRDSQNAVWLVTLCATWGNGRGLIDEFHHGFGRKRSFVALLGQFLLTPWGWACLQCALAGGFYVWSLRHFGSLAGPPARLRHSAVERSAAAERMSPVALITARGGLFAAARARRLAVELMHQYLKYRIGKSVGYAVNIDEASARARLAARTTPVAAHLEHYVPLVQRALHDGPISDHDVLEIGQRAARLCQELRST
jgi:hypothetical protein